MELKEWVKTARTHKGMTQEQLGHELGLTKGNISGWENGRHEPGYAQLLKIELVTGFKLNRDDHPAGGLSPRDQSTTYGGMAPIMAWDHEDDLPPGEYVMIPRLDVHLSAGAGKEQVEIDFVKKQPQAFRADWIREERLKPKYLACMTADGRSMEPYIFHKDSLVVDTSKKDVQDGKVYALWYEGGERVKRLFQLPGGGLRIHSDNTVEFGDIDLDVEHVGDVRIIGQVVLRSGKGGL